jgi:hypothetical protein
MTFTAMETLNPVWETTLTLEVPPDATEVEVQVQGKTHTHTPTHPHALIITVYFFHFPGPRGSHSHQSAMYHIKQPHSLDSEGFESIKLGNAFQVWDHDAWGDNDFLGMASVTINHLKMKMHKFHGFSMKLESDYRSVLYFSSLFKLSQTLPFCKPTFSCGLPFIIQARSSSELRQCQNQSLSSSSLKILDPNP